MNKYIDLNCDMGEGFGAYSFGADEEIIKYISSANIACGGHAGDPHVMNKTVELAKAYNVCIGAHPGFPDLAGFGRRLIPYTNKEIYQMIVFQIGSIQAFCTVHQVNLNHVKPHGALYNMAANKRGAADAIARAIHDVDPQLILYGLAGSELVKAGHQIGLQVASEVFADRTYQADGKLTPRNRDGALIDDTETAAEQVRRMIDKGEVFSVTGEIIPIEADTVCVHGDGSNAVNFVKKLRQILKEQGIQIKGVSN
ncbi:LamB/YcsF family protein [Virgibacillus halodenitrificans]|uniref:LamB/YcsF family protein n=1 Tax=Virgibacillus halodenitrificans TaxID=1482 RepID=UPI002DBCD785|nr:5-oxoprolinase subunit PxpA [Virgibacillus halodenitrificans]MEC2160566.1 5-oxoprolinase subunit PxpA [Virgibacillus halodenitrificans]